MCRYLVLVFLATSTFSLAAETPAANGVIAGIVLDPTGAAVPGARAELFSVQGTVLGETSTGPDGTFQFKSIPQGSHVLRIESRNLQSKSIHVTVGRQAAPRIEIKLDLLTSVTLVTVTSELGGASAVEESPRVVVVRGRDELLQRPLPTIGHVFEASPGVTVQETTRGQVSPLMRGLTGYQTLLLVDGIRYNTSIFRSGPNQYLAWLDPAQSQTLEAMLGPSSSQYGSDSLGGTINLGTPNPRFGSGSGLDLHGQAGIWGSSADLASGGDFLGSLGTSRLSWIFGGYGRKLNDLRGGNGEDSHHTFRRFFGLSGSEVSSLLGSRMQDTSFAQTGFENKVAFRFSATQSLTLQHLFSDQRNVRSYRDRIGGVGRLQGLVAPQRLNFGYARYEKLALGFLDSISGTFSINSQSDGYTRQDLRVTDPVVRDDNRVDAYGYSGRAQTHIGSRNALVVGGDLYRESIFSTRITRNSVTGLTTRNRPQYPNNSRYTNSGVFVEDTFELVPGRLRGMVGVRWTFAAFESRAKDNIGPAGEQFGVTDSDQHFGYFSFNTSLSYQIGERWSVNGLMGRGIRAPNATDLSSIGLTTLGFDVPASDASASGALIGTDGSEGARSTGREYGALRAENLTSYELGVHFDSRRFYARVQGFDSELLDPLVGRTLVFPAGRVPDTIGGYAVTALPQTAAQRQQGVFSVATALAPRAVRSIANEGAIRYYGLESMLRFRISRQLGFESNYSYLAGRELNPNRPVRRLPPQRLHMSLRYTPSGRIWLEPLATFSGSQYRMNAADYDDDRMGASRHRGNIADFFRGGYASQFVAAGPDGRLGTADDLFTPTGETLRQIQDRVLPLGQVVNGIPVAGDSTRVPLYLGTGSWWMLGLRGGASLSERLSFNFSAMNLSDRNYRTHGSGNDSPGFNGSAGFRYSF